MSAVIRFFAYILPLLLIASIFLTCASYHYYAAQIYAENYQWDRAIEFLKKSIVENPKDIRSYILLGQVYAAQERFELMNLAFEKAESLIDEPSESVYWQDLQLIRDDLWNIYFDAGVDYYENGQFAEAGFCFYQCNSIKDSQSDGYQNLGLVEERLGLVDSAIAHYQMAFSRDTSKIELMFYTSDLCLENEHYEKSIEIVNQILKIKPSNQEAILQKAVSFDMAGEIDSAIIYYQKAIATRGMNLDLYYNLGRLFFIKGDYLAAIEKFKKIIDESPQEGETLALIGECYFSLGQDMILEQQKAFPDSVIQAADGAVRFFEKSKIFLEKAIENGYDNPDIRNMLSVAIEKLNQKEKLNSAENMRR